MEEYSIYLVTHGNGRKAFATKEDAIKDATSIISEFVQNYTGSRKIETVQSEEYDDVTYVVYTHTPGFLFGKYVHEAERVTIEHITLFKRPSYDMDATVIENEDLLTDRIHNYGCVEEES